MAVRFETGVDAHQLRVQTTYTPEFVACCPLRRSTLVASVPHISSGLTVVMVPSWTRGPRVLSGLPRA